MIIVSQNKKEIYNFEKISCISVEKNYHQSINEKDFTYDVYINGDIEDVRNIGSYPSLDRAKEVLQEIYKYKDELEHTKFLGYTEAFWKSTTFEMPGK